MEVGKGPFVELRMVLLSTSKQKESKRLDGVCNFENPRGMSLEALQMHSFLSISL